MTDAPEVDDVAARALASIIFERTADAINEEGANAADALIALCENTGLVPDVCAAVLYVTSAIAGAAGLAPAEVYGLAMAFEPDEGDDLDDDETAVPGVTHEAPDDDEGPEATDEAGPPSVAPSPGMAVFDMFGRRL